MERRGIGRSGGIHLLFDLRGVTDASLRSRAHELQILIIQATNLAQILLKGHCQKGKIVDILNEIEYNKIKINIRKLNEVLYYLDNLQ